MRLLPYGDRALLVELDDLHDVRRWHAAVTDADLTGVVDLVPAARTLLVVLDPALTTTQRIADALGQVTPRAVPVHHERVVEVPVVYDGDDLAEVAELTGLTTDEVVSRHSVADYAVAFGGFAPGFAYLSGLDPALRVPRRESPRTRVPTGAVAIAGEWAAVYPRPSPGGWRLLGRTDLVLFDVDRDPPALLAPGVRVRFVST